MPVIVPITTSVKQRFTTQLGEWSFGFYFYYNDRSERWIFDLYDATTGLPLVLGQPVVLGQDFLEPYVFGIGTLFAFDTTVHHGEAGPDDLGVRVIMPYFTPAEMGDVRVIPPVGEAAEIERPVVVARPIYGGVGLRGATGGTLEGNTFVLNSSDHAVLFQLQNTAESTGQGWTFRPDNQAIYILLASGAWTIFLDDISKLQFPMNAPIPVTVGERTMYLYQSTNALFDAYKPTVQH